VSKDEQSCVAETLVEVSESKEMVQPVPRAMVQYESSKVVANLSNEPSGKSFFDTLAEELSSAMIIFTIIAAWYRSRIFIMLQSAMKMFLGTAHGCTNQQKEFIKVTDVIQMKIYLLVASAINRLKEIIYSYNAFGPLLPIGAKVKIQQHLCVISAAGTALVSVLQHLAMLFAVVKGVFQAIQTKIYLFIASAINRWKEIINSYDISTVLGPLLPIEAEVKVEQHLCCISAAGTALISVLQHLAMLFAVVKGVLLEYKPSRLSHLPAMKQFASMFLVLLIGLLTLLGGSSNTVSTGLWDVSFPSVAVIFDDDHLSTDPTRSDLLDTQSLLTTFVSNEDLMIFNSGLLDEDDQILSTFGWSGYDDGLLSQTDLYQGDVASTALSLDWDTSDCIHLGHSMDASGAILSSLSMICTQDLARDHLDVVSSQDFVSKYYSAVVVFKQSDIYTMSAIVVDSRIASGFDPYQLSSLELPAYSPLGSGGEETSNAPMFAELSTPEEGTPYLSESNGDLAEISFHEAALPVQLPDGSSSSSIAPRLSWNSTGYEVSASAQTEVAISSVLVYEPDPFTLVRWLPRPASSLIKADNILNTWELRHLVFMMLLIVVCRDSDTNTDHLEGTSKSLPTNSQETLENEALFDDQGDEAEESLTTASHKHKYVSRESTALRSDLGRHWNSSPKRRCRRSPRKRRKVTRYQPM